MKSLQLSSSSQNKTFFYVLIGLGMFFIVSIIFLVFCLQRIVGHSSGLLVDSNEITLIEIEGPIDQSDDIVRRIKHFEKSASKALLIRLNSPGGAVAPSQEIYAELLRTHEDKKIVVASMSSLAASGAYYIASAADKIIADPGTLTGSIGVIAEFPDASNLLEKVGVKFQTIKSGKFKDTGTFDRAMTPEERTYLQETINDVFQQFVQSVLDSRRKIFAEKLAQNLNVDPTSLTDTQIRNYILQYADGRVLTGKRAVDLGFVDQLGNYEDAINETAQLAGIKGEPIVNNDQSIKLNQFLNSILPFSFLTKQICGFELEYRTF
jgi:protease-4